MKNETLRQVLTTLLISEGLDSAVLVSVTDDKRVDHFLNVVDAALHICADFVEANEPRATNSIHALRDAALSLPADADLDKLFPLAPTSAAAAVVVDADTVQQRINEAEAGEAADVPPICRECVKFGDCRIHTIHDMRSTSACAARQLRHV